MCLSEHSNDDQTPSSMHPRSWHSGLADALSVTGFITGHVAQGRGDLAECGRNNMGEHGHTLQSLYSGGKGEKYQVSIRCLPSSIWSMFLTYGVK